MAEDKECNAIAGQVAHNGILKVWRDGRVVECGGLESRCTACRYRGFESLSLRRDSGGSCRER